MPGPPPSVPAGCAAVIVPARLASTRFPRKVLADRTGRPLVQHVVDAARRARCAGSVVVAADHPEIADALAPFGTPVLMTRVDHPNGTARLAEAAALLRLGPGAIIVNAQGDEPELDPAALDAAVAALLQTPNALVGTVAAPLTDPRDHADPNVVKVVRRLDGSALLFSRAPIPHHRDAPAAQPDPARAPAPALRHVGLYAYTRAGLDQYVAWPPSPLERAEQLEQLRVLERGGVIGVALIDAAHPGIDTPGQYDAFVARYRAAHAGDGAPPR